LVALRLGFAVLLPPGVLHAVTARAFIWPRCDRFHCVHRTESL